MLIGELSRLTGCNSHQLRYYEAQGLLTPERSRNGYRRYSAEAVDSVRSITTLLAVGLSTNAIRQLLPLVQNGSDLGAWPTLGPALHARLTAVDEQIRALLESRQVILDCFAQMQQHGSALSPAATAGVAQRLASPATNETG